MWHNCSLFIKNIMNTVNHKKVFCRYQYFVKHPTNQPNCLMYFKSFIFLSHHTCLLKSLMSKGKKKNNFLYCYIFILNKIILFYCFKSVYFKTNYKIVIICFVFLHHLSSLSSVHFNKTLWKHSFKRTSKKKIPHFNYKNILFKYNKWN